MAEAKTVRTRASVPRFLGAIENEVRREGIPWPRRTGMLSGVTGIGFPPEP
jgi:hypothetical protein